MVMDASDSPEPVRESIKFEVNAEDYPNDVAQLLLSIKKAAEDHLYRWKSFPICLPPPVSFASSENFEIGAKKPDLKSLFILPNFDELDAVALDIKGEQRMLSNKQLWNIRDNGQFDVDSVNFAGQVHTWKLSQLLQKGTDTSYKSLLNDLAWAARFIIVTAKNRFHSDFFSLSQSLLKFATGFLRLIDMLIGVPSLQTNDLQAKLREERSKYLVAELVAQPNVEDDLDNVCLFVKQQIHKQSMEKYDISCECVPKVPYLYMTPKGTEIDLRLFDRHVMRRALMALAAILERESKGWFIKYREKIVFELKAKKLSEDDIERLANVSIMDEYMDRISNAILHDQVIAELGQHIGELLIRHAWSIILMHRAVDNVHNKVYTAQNKLFEDVQRKHPILSLIGPWIDEYVQRNMQKMMCTHKWSAHEEALMLCRAKQLNQPNYFLNRDLIFMKEREPVLLKELSRVKTATRTFQWRTQIWSPHSWKVTRVFQGQTDVIPTVICENANSTSNPRAEPNQPVFLIEKQHTMTSSTKWPFWRWTNYLLRTWTCTWNAMFFFGVVIPWCSPVSLRALFLCSPFMPDLELSQVNGNLFARKSSATETLNSRLVGLWRHISKSRTQFESKPDTGFIGKGLTRHINRFWNYVVKGGIGTGAIIIVLPVVCLVVSICSLVCAITAPFWMPVIILIYHLFFLFFDFDSPDEKRNNWLVVVHCTIWMMLVQGVVQAVLCIAIAFIICPLFTFMITLFAILRYSLRMVWDGLMFHCIIKQKGRIPAGDSFIVKRIAGPGLSSTYYYQIKSEQALCAFEAKLEMDQLEAYKQQNKRVIYEPLKLFSDFVGELFGPFSATLTKSGIYKALEKECDAIYASLEAKVDKRKAELLLDISMDVRSKVKLNMNELKLTVRHAAKMLQHFYPNHVFEQMQVPEDTYWQDRGLAFRDWTGLCGALFSELFSPQFLIPLEETDTIFKLEVEHMDIARFITMLASADYTDDLGDVSVVTSPKGNIHITPPFIDLTTFNPRGRMGASVHKVQDHKSRKPWKNKKKKDGESGKLMIPLAVPHPCHIAIIIYNRENDEPIAMDSEACQKVLEAIEQAVGVSSEHNVYVYDDRPISADDEQQGDASSYTSKRSSIHVNIDSTENPTNV